MTNNLKYEHSVLELQQPLSGQGGTCLSPQYSEVQSKNIVNLRPAWAKNETLFLSNPSPKFPKYTYGLNAIEKITARISFYWRPLIRLMRVNMSTAFKIRNSKWQTQVKYLLEGQFCTEDNSLTFQSTQFQLLASTRLLSTICNLSAGVCNALFCCLWAWYTCERNPHVHTMKIKFQWLREHFAQLGINKFPIDLCSDSHTNSCRNNAKRQVIATNPWSQLAFRPGEIRSMS